MMNQKLRQIWRWLIIGPIAQRIFVVSALRSSILFSPSWWAMELREKMKKKPLAVGRVSLLEHFNSYKRLASLSISWRLTSLFFPALSQEMTLSIELFFQFLSLCRKSLQKGNSSEDLRPVVIRGLMSFSLWIREDESLHSLLVDSYEDLIQFSKLPTLDYTQTSTIHLSQAMKEQTLALLFQTPSPDSLDESDSTKISGGVGSVLLLRTRVRSSSLSSLPQQQQPHELRNEILLLSETFLDPFVSTLDCVLTILSADTMSQKLSSVAICALPQIHSSLVTLLSDMQRFLARRQQQQQMAIEIQQELSLCSIISEFLFHLLISPTNQMRESLQVVATSSDPAAGEYLRVSCGGWKTLISEITVVAQLGNRGGADLLSRSELVDYQNLVERLGSLEELLRNLFHL
jgi:hypothetical protein